MAIQMEVVFIENDSYQTKEISMQPYKTELCKNIQGATC